MQSSRYSIGTKIEVDATCGIGQGKAVASNVKRNGRLVTASETEV